MCNFLNVGEYVCCVLEANISISATALSSATRYCTYFERHFTLNHELGFKNYVVTGQHMRPQCTSLLVYIQIANLRDTVIIVNAYKLGDK